MIDNYDWDRLDGLGFAEGTKDGLKSACWKGYEAIGMKTKNGRKVPNCVPVKKDAEHGEGDVATAEMTPNYLPKEPIPGGGDLKNPQMGEHKQRMPRMEDIKKANAHDGHLALLDFLDAFFLNGRHDYSLRDGTDSAQLYCKIAKL